MTNERIAESVLSFIHDILNDLNAVSLYIQLAEESSSGQAGLNSFAGRVDPLNKAGSNVLDLVARLQRAQISLGELRFPGHQAAFIESVGKTLAGVIESYEKNSGEAVGFKMTEGESQLMISSDGSDLAKIMANSFELDLLSLFEDRLDVRESDDGRTLTVEVLSPEACV